MNEYTQTVMTPMAETDLQQIKRVGAILDDLHLQKEALDEEMKELNTKIKTIAQERLPEMMEDLGIEKIKLASGKEIQLSTFYNAKIPPAEWANAVEWLEKTHNDGIIKSGFSVTMNRGEKQLADEAKDALRKVGIAVEVEDKIHPSTLKAFVREQIENEEELPREIFGVYEGKIVKFK